MTDFTIQKGDTYSVPLCWEDDYIVYKAISGITKAAPAVVTATAHGVPDGWRVAVVSVKGMTQINAELDSKGKPKTYHLATVLTANTIELNDVNASDYGAWTSGGSVQYFAPVDLAGFTARMKIRTKIGGTLLASTELADAPLNILTVTVDNATKLITIGISATNTAAIAWSKGVFDLEMVSSGGTVTKIIKDQPITAVGEITV